MPRPDHYPPDIMDKAQAFTDALNAYWALIDSWDRRYSPSQIRIPSGRSGGGQWTSGGGSAPTGAMEGDRPGFTPIVYRPGDRPPGAGLRPGYKPGLGNPVFGPQWPLPHL